LFAVSSNFSGSCRGTILSSSYKTWYWLWEIFHSYGMPRLGLRISSSTINARVSGCR
jgi:hypothetical protein